MSASFSAPAPVSYSGAKLYYTASSCGAASFIIAYTAALKGLLTEQIDTNTHVTLKSGTDFYSINPKGNVPTLVLCDGTVLNEGAAILQFLADQKPEAKLAGAWGSLERYRVMNALNHISSEVHPAIGGLFGANDNNRQNLKERALKKLQYLEKEIKGKFYVNEQFTVADSYLYIVLNWHQWIGLSLDNYPAVKKYYEGIKALPNVQAAHKLMETNPEKIQ